MNKPFGGRKISSGEIFLPKKKNNKVQKWKNEVHANNGEIKDQFKGFSLYKGVSGICREQGVSGSVGYKVTNWVAFLSLQAPNIIITQVL